MRALLFSVAGEPVGQGRPRFTTRGGVNRAYDPAKSRNNKEHIRLMAKQAMEETGFVCTEKPLKIEITARMGIPASKSKKFKERALQRLEYPTKKPDADNIIKGVLDALNGVCYKDDKQIVNIQCIKVYDTEPRIDICLKVFL